MKSYFIYSNVKVNPYILNDIPIPGFELLLWEHEVHTIGTLIDMGFDAGFTPVGNRKVSGQIWVLKDLKAENILESCVGAKSGITEPIEIDVQVNSNSGVVEKIKAKTYRIKEFKAIYKVCEFDTWWIRKIG